MTYIYTWDQILPMLSPCSVRDLPEEMPITEWCVSGGQGQTGTNREHVKIFYCALFAGKSLPAASTSTC